MTLDNGRPSFPEGVWEFLTSACGYFREPLQLIDRIRFLADRGA